MDLTRIKFLAGNLEEGANLYAEPKADHHKKSFADSDSHAHGKDHKDKPEMEWTKPETSKKTGDKSGDGKKPGGHPDGKVVKKDIDMQHSHKKGGKGHTDEPKANHSMKLGGKKVHVKEWAEAIVESGDVEGTMRELLAALEEAGVKL